MNYKLRELYNKYTILSKYEQNPHFIQIASCFQGSFYCFGMLQVRKNEISLRKNSGGAEYLHTLRRMHTFSISAVAGVCVVIS